MKKLEFYTRSTYGNDHMYLVDETVKEAVTQLTSEKTLTPRAKEAMEKLGYTFVEILPPKN